MNDLNNLHQELHLEVLNRYLSAFPEKAVETAIDSFEDYLSQLTVYSDLLNRYERALACLQAHAGGDAEAREILIEEYCNPHRKKVFDILPRLKSMGF